MERACVLIGTVFMMCWVFALGPVGAFLLAGVAYAMSTDNLALGLICALGMLSPVFLSIVWGGLMLTARLTRSEGQEEARLRYLRAED